MMKILNKNVNMKHLDNKEFLDAINEIRKERIIHNGIDRYDNR